MRRSQPSDAPVEFDVCPENVWSAVGRLLGVASGALPTQVARVLRRIVPGTRIEEVRSPEIIVSSFRSRRLLPERLLDVCRSVVDAGNLDPRLATPEVLAVCFASSLYPQRAFQLWDHGIRLRVAAFGGFLKSAGSLDEPRIALARQMTEHGRQDISANLHRWLSDLGGYDDLHCDDRERDARADGATLHLATCYPTLAEKMYDVWSGEAAFVRYLRQRAIQTSPSALTGEPRGVTPVWSRVVSKLGVFFPEQDIEQARAAVHLEQIAVRHVGARQYAASADMINRLVEAFWESTWDRLMTGFPYYAFASRFSYWWRQCLEHHDWSDGRLISLDERHDMAAVPSAMDAIPPELDRGHLRATRENYRLVRATFFRRAGVEPVARDAWLAASDHESVRRVLDALWYERVERLLNESSPDRDTTLPLRRIAERFDDVTPGAINTMSHRLRLRMWAAGLARFDRRTNAEMLSTPHPGLSASERYPLRGERGAIAPACASRIVPPAQTLLWVFTVYVFLHPKLEPQRPDRWTFARVVRELWHWVTDAAFVEAVHAGARAGSRANQTALRAMQASPLGDLVRTLQGVEAEEALDAYVASTDFSAECATAVAVVRELAGDSADTWHVDVPRWRRIAHTHWIVPVWYLTVVERMATRDMLHATRPGPDEVDEVLALHRDMLTSRKDHR